VTYYEREAVNPTTKTIERIAAVFKMTPAELMEGIESTQRKRSGPPSRLENIFEQISQLSKTRQKLVADMLEGFLEKTS
jgi:transcriptional regulator with XRE-family HTH domain